MRDKLYTARIVGEELKGPKRIKPIDVKLYDVIIAKKGTFSKATQGDLQIENVPFRITIAEMLKNVKDSNGQPYVNQDGTLAIRKDNDFYQKEEYTGKKDLIAYHNISQENLDKAIQLGGLVVPSIAVTKKETDFSNFGTITLLMPQDVVNPKETPVYTRDAWTGVFPGILKASDEIEKEGEMGGFPGMEGMMGGEEKKPPQMPPGKPPEMPKQTQDADISNSKGDGKEIWRTTETGRKYLINTETGKVVGGSPVMPIGEVVGKSKAEEPPVDYEKIEI